ncbi:MAG TPA: ribonuclease T2 [Dongiaceae bacterium]|nr:ribonuclease T2 [Dongiaceae bacterium]
MARPRAQPPYIALALAATFLSACDESPAVTHYVLALSWQPAFCEFNARRPECRALDPGDFAATHLTVHGLWPNDRPNAGPIYCGIDGETRALDEPKSWCQLPEPEMSGKTRAHLAQTMPGVLSCLDRHEWIKHGTCAGMGAERYFGETLRLASAVQTTAFGRAIAANVGREVTAEQLIQAFEASFGKGSARALTLVCSDRGGYLSEIRIALQPSALEGELDRGDLDLDGPAPAPRCPEAMRIDAAGP